MQYIVLAYSIYILVKEKGSSMESITPHPTQAHINEPNGCDLISIRSILVSTVICTLWYI